ncbi:ppg3-related protein-like protein [Lotmaria passim]
MMQRHDKAPPDGSKRRASLSSFDRWLVRMQRKGSRDSSSNRLYNSGDYRSCSVDDYHVDPSDGVLSLSPQPTASAPSGFYSQPGLSRLEELEGLLFTQNRFSHPCALTRGEDQRFGSQQGAMCALDGAAMYGAGYRPPPLQGPSTNRLLCLPESEADFSSMVGAAAAAAAGRYATNTTYNGCGGAASLSTLSEPLGGTEADRYIARLEEEVQLLMRESGERDRLMLTVVAARETVALQLEEASRRSAIEWDECAAAQTITYGFMRTLSFYRTLEERSRAMELNTQIVILEHKLKLSETMRQQVETTATSTAASTAATQALQRRLEEQQLAESVTATVRGLLEQEYAQLTALMSAMPSKVQTLLDEHQEVKATRAEAAVPQATAALSSADAAQLLSLVSRVQHYQDVVLELYCDAVDAKASQAQYELNIVRLIFEKQSSLTWAALYEEKKDEVRHLNEELMEMRKELRAAVAATNTATAGVTPRGLHNVSSFAGSTSSQSYEAYAAPYVPVKKKSSQAHHNAAVSASTATPARVPVPRKSIGELREEARRLGAHPAVYYPQPVTSPSPSMPSLYVSHTPSAVDQTVLRLNSPSHRDSPPRTPERHSTSLTKSPVVAVIRSFAPRSASRGASASSSSSSSLPIAAAAAEPKKRVGTPLAAEMSAAKEAQMTAASAKHSKAAGKNKAPLPSSRSSSASSSISTHTADVPATPVPAVHATAVKVSALQHVATTASSSSSLSSTHFATTTGLSTGNAASSPSPKAGPTPTAQAVHNSFDDDNDDSSEEAAAIKAAATTLPRKNGKPQDQQQRQTVKATAKVSPKTESPPAVQVKRISLDEAIRALERAKLGRASGGADSDSDDNDDDTSSLSLSTTSDSSASHPGPRVAQAKAAAAVAATEAKTKKTSIKVPQTKPTHIRKSSFDDDDDDDDDDDGVAGSDSRGQCNPSSKPPLSHATSTPPLGKSAATSKPEPAAVVSAASTSKKPHKLKLPTW